MASGIPPGGREGAGAGWRGVGGVDGIKLDWSGWIGLDLHWVELGWIGLSSIGLHCECTHVFLCMCGGGVLKVDGCRPPEAGYCAIQSEVLCTGDKSRCHEVILFYYYIIILLYYNIILLYYIIGNNRK